MDAYYVVGAMAIPYLEYGWIITIGSKEEKTYLVSCPECTCLDFAKISSMAGGRFGQWVSCKHLYYIFKFFYKVDYVIDKFIHAPKFNYNEVVHLLNLMGMA